MYISIFNPTEIQIGHIDHAGEYTSSRRIKITTAEGESITITLHGKAEDLENISLPPIDDLADLDQNLPESLRRQAD